jgi:hypothetical protein
MAKTISCDSGRIAAYESKMFGRVYLAVPKNEEELLFVGRAE